MTIVKLDACFFVFFVIQVPFHRYLLILSDFLLPTKLLQNRPINCVSVVRAKIQNFFFVGTSAKKNNNKP